MLHRHRLRRLTRRPAPFWLAAAVLAIVTATTVDHVTSAAASARDRWGERRPVVVALHDLEPGDVLDGVEVRLLPRALVPDGALRRVEDGVVTAWIAAGEVVVRQRVAPGGLSPTAARLPPGTRGVAVPQGVAPLPVEVGDRVGDDSVTVAVDRVDAASVAQAVTSASVTLVLSGAR